MRRFFWLLFSLPLLLGAAAPVATDPVREADLPPVRLSMSDRLADLRVEGGRVIVDSDDGELHLTGEQFVNLLEMRGRRGESRGWFYRLLDVTAWTGMIWVALGLLGQVLFTGRMVIQWLASEKEKRSVVPPVFWWMSLIGASMLITYFTWRVDIVGILGQATGWGIYARNLWLIYRPHEPAVTAISPGQSAPSLSPAVEAGR